MYQAIPFMVSHCTRGNLAISKRRYTSTVLEFHLKDVSLDFGNNWLRILVEPPTFKNINFHLMC